jgi:hypothetical protein
LRQHVDDLRFHTSLQTNHTVFAGEALIQSALISPYNAGIEVLMASNGERRFCLVECRLAVGGIGPSRFSPDEARAENCSGASGGQSISL